MVKRILLYFIGMIKDGTSLVQYGFSVVQYEMPFSLMDINELEVPSAVQTVNMQVLIAVK